MDAINIAEVLSGTAGARLAFPMNAHYRTIAHGASQTKALSTKVMLPRVSRPQTVVLTWLRRLVAAHSVTLVVRFLIQALRGERSTTMTRYSPGFKEQTARIDNPCISPRHEHHRR